MNIIMRIAALALIASSLGLSFTSVAHADLADQALAEYEDVRQGAVAGVRSVGNGGGYAEMQAEFINLRLQTWIANAPPAVTIEIEPRCAVDPIRVVSANIVRVAACALYKVPAHETLAQPKQFNEIATWVLTARLMAEGSDFKNAFRHASQQFGSFSQYEESLEISLTSGNFLFHDLSIQMNGNSSKVLSLEGREKAHDITALALNQIRCGTADATAWATRDSYARATGRTGALISSSITWTCIDGTRWEGQLLTSFDSENDAVKSSSIILHVVQRRQVAK